MSERYTHLDSIKVDGIASTSQQGALIGASKVMPQPSADLDGVTIQYMGPTDSTYTFKRMYTCAMVGSEYKWIDATPVDVVQNNNGVFIGGTEIGVADSTKYGVMSPEQSEKVATSFEKLETVKEGAEPNKVDIIRVEGTPLQVSGSDKSVNITRDALGLGDSAQLDVGTLEGQIPVLGANGQLPKSTIPPYATGTYVGSVRTKALLTSLTTAEIGDWAKVTSDDDFNNNGEYILNGTAPGVLTNWVQMVGPANVESVNGKSGRVVLDKEDIGLANVDNTSDAKKPISEATQSALNDCVKLSGSDSAQVIANGGLQIPNGDVSVGGGALIGKDTEPALLRVRGSIEATQTISGQLVQTENVASNDSSTKVASTAWVASADSVVHTAGDTMTGNLTINKDTGELIFKSTHETSYVPDKDSVILGQVSIRDVNSTFNGGMGIRSYADGIRKLSTIVVSKNGVQSSINLLIDANDVAYATAPSWSVGTADNTDKILTTKMANSLPSLVHTTGNEEISGVKTFTDIVNMNYLGKNTQYNTIVSVNTPLMCIRTYNNTSNIIAYRTPEGTMFRFNMRNANNVWHMLDFINKDNGDCYATIPPTTDAYPDTAIVTKGYLQSTIEQASLSKQPYVVAFDPAVAVTNATNCIKYQGHCASYTKPVMSNNVLNRGSWTDDEYLLKRMQYCTFRPDGTIKEVLYKNDLTKVWIKNYADETPDTPIYANGELMEFCATQTQPSEIPSDATESSITTLDTMLVIPTLYTYGDERGFKVSYDPSQGSAEAHTLDGHVYKYEAIGVYLASNSSDGTTIMSVSDAEPLRNTSRYAFRGKLVTKDQTNGKWKLFNYYDSRMFKLLAFLIGGSLNSQAVFGAGLSTDSMGINVSGETDAWRRNYATYTGKTNTVGMLGQSSAFTQKFDVDKYGVYDNGNTTQVRQVKFLIEAPWSQDWQFMDDACYEPSTGRFFAGTNSASAIQSADDNNGLFFTNQVANPTLMEHILTITDTDGLPGLTANPNGAYSSMLRTEDKAWGMPVDKVGSSTTGTCDGWAVQPRTISGVRNSGFGGAANTGPHSGVACYLANDMLSFSWIHNGARACFLFD